MQTLKQLQVPTKTMVVDYPGLPGFSIKVNYLSRQISTKLRQDATVTKIDHRYGGTTSELDEDLFMEAYTKAAISDWSGLKYKYLEQLMPVDLSSVGDEDLEKELPYSAEDAVILVKESPTFDKWLTDIIYNIESFRTREKN